MNETVSQTPDKKPTGDTARDNPRGKEESAQPPKSRFEKFASTQAGGNGIEGDVLKPDKTIDDKLGANMADRK
jgi:hypothetical protein